MLGKVEKQFGEHLPSETLVNSAPPQSFVGGVDTHNELHVAAVIDENKLVLGSEFYAATRKRYQQMLSLTTSFGTVAGIGVEGTDSHCGGILTYLQNPSDTVLEVTAPDKKERCRRGKSDTFITESAAHGALLLIRTITPKTRSGMIEALRVLKVCRNTVIAARRITLQMTLVIKVSAPDELRYQMRRLTPLRGRFVRFSINTLHSAVPALDNSFQHRR